MTRHLVVAAVVGVLSAGPASGQGVPQGVAGAELRTVSFEGLPLLKRLRQVATPVGVVIPAGRFTFDIGGSWVSTRMDRHDGTHHVVDALTDTQVRGAYVLGRDAVVLTVMANLPTGLDNATPKDFTVIGAISPGLLGFPVATYASGFSVTTGLAAAVQSGEWSFGLAGSVRMSREFTPYADLEGPITYRPGVEGRIRAGADGLVGQSRLSLGFTFSTFGDDQFGQGGTLRGAYRPGSRWMGEAALVAPIGASSLSIALWTFRRSAGDTTGASARNKENLGVGEVVATIPLASWLDLEPQIVTRISFPELGSAWFGGGGSGFRIRLSDVVSLVPTLRYDIGEIDDGAGHKVDLKGLYASAFVRITP